jgi:hypothetical protein
MPSYYQAPLDMLRRKASGRPPVNQNIELLIVPTVGCVTAQRTNHVQQHTKFKRLQDGSATGIFKNIESLAHKRIQLDECNIKVQGWSTSLFQFVDTVPEKGSVS